MCDRASIPGKVKRSRNNPQITIVPSDRVGQPLSDWVIVQGEVVEAEVETQAVKDLF